MYVFELGVEVTTREGKTVTREEKYTLDLVHTEPLDSSPSVIQGYSKQNKKYWVLGYSDSTIELRDFNGTEPKSNKVEVPVTSMDRVGQQISYGGDGTVGIYNLASMEPYVQCEKVMQTQTTSAVIDLALDYYNSYIYTVLANGDIVIFDSKVSQTACKRKN